MHFGSAEMYDEIWLMTMNEALESSLLAAYTEMTYFCARTINFCRSNLHCEPLVISSQ
jgi:hypothetical protein